MKIPRILTYALLAAATAFSTRVTAQETSGTATKPLPQIAVNNLEGRGVSADEASTLSDVLRNELINTGKYRVMERGEMEGILKEQGFQQSGACSDEACIIEMGQLLGAELLIAGSIGKVGKAYSVNVRIVSVRTAEILSNVSHSYTGPIEDLLTREMQIVARKLAGQYENPREETSEISPESQKGNRNRKPVIIGAVALGTVAVGGTAAYLLLSKDNPEESEPATTGVELSW